MVEFSKCKNGIMQNVLLRLFMMRTKAGFANLALNFCIHTIKYVAKEIKVIHP